jgi:CHAT domain-containing protein
VVQRVRVTRLDVILILILVVAGASIWPVTSALVAVSRQDRAPRELDYQIRYGVHALRIRLKGLENQVGTLLSNNGVLLALLNSCDTGTSGNNAAVTGVAGTLVGQGIPAVVATLRQVADQAAIMFTKNFYSALVEGESVEAAMYQTRTALEIERQDWSVYALYASTHDLDRLVADVPRRRATPVVPA